MHSDGKKHCSNAKKNERESFSVNFKNCMSLCDYNTLENGTTLSNVTSLNNLTAILNKNT